MRSLDCDVLVVGSHIAGSMLAALIGAAGHDVVLVDRARFPSPTASTHFFRGAGGVAALAHLGVLDDVLALGAPELFCQYDYVAEQRTPIVSPPQNPGGLGFCLSVRRDRLDEILVRRAGREPHGNTPPNRALTAEELWLSKQFAWRQPLRLCSGRAGLRW